MAPRLPATPTGPAPRRSFLEEVLAGRGSSRAGGLGRLGAAQDEQRPAQGTPEDVLRRASTAFENKQEQAAALGVEETGEGPKGFLEAIAGPLSVLDLPRSAVFSTLSGNPTRIGEHRGFGDTGLLKVDEGDSVLERGVKGAAAFVGDVATDPLSYVTFGVGPIGKKALSRVLGHQARRIAVDLSDDAVEAWAARATRFRGGQKIREVAEGLDDTAKAVADQYDEVLAQPPSTWTGTPDEWKAHLGREEFSGAVVEAYQRGGSTGLRRFLRDELGEEAGEQAFDALPLDLKGGPRLRVPFAKDDRGLAKTLPFSGDERLQGGGRLTDALFGEGASAKLEEVHRLRNRARASRLGSLVADRFTGDPQGRLYGQMVRDLYAQGDDGLDRVTWRAYEAIVDADEVAKGTTRRLRNEAAMVLGRVEQMLEGAGDEAAQSRARELFVDRFNDPARSRDLASAGEWQARTGEPLRFEGTAADPETIGWYEGLDDVERRAVTAALDVQQHFEHQLRELRAAGMDVREIRDYVARILTDEEKLAREGRKPVRRSQQQGGKQGSTDPTGERKRWVDGDLVEGPDGELHLELRWRTPEEVNKLEGRPVFETDPTQIVAKYADAVSRATAKVQFANLVNEAGVTVPGGVAIRRSVQEARIGQVARAVEEQAAVARDEVERVRETLELDVAEARAAEAAAKQGQREAREQAAGQDAVAAAAERVARTPQGGLLEDPPEGWVRLWRADAPEPDDGMVTLYRGMAEPFDPARADSSGVRFTDDLDYALNNTNPDTHLYLYRTRVPRERLLSADSPMQQAGLAPAGPGGALLRPDEVGEGLLVDADDVLGRRFVADAPAEGRLSYVDVPERVAADMAKGDGVVLPDELARLARPAAVGPADPLLSRPRGEVIEEAGDEAVSAAEAELRRVAAEERLAEFEARQADRSELAEDRDAAAGAGEFVFEGIERFRTPVVNGLFGPNAGEIELPNAAVLSEAEAAELDSLTSALHAAGFEQVDIRTREPSSYEQYLEAVNQVEEEYLVDVWAPTSESALEDLRRVFVEQVDRHLPDGWEAQAFERFGRRAIADGEVRPSMTTQQVAAELSDPASEGDRAFAATGITLDGPIEDVAVAVRFLMMADEAGFDVRLEGFATPVAHTEDTARVGGARRKGDKVVGISRGVQFQTRAWAVLGGTAEAKRELARRFADGGVDVGTEALALRKAGKAERVTLARVQGRDLAAERETFDGWMQDRRAEYADDPMVEGERLEQAAETVRQRRIDAGQRAAKKEATYAHGEQHAAPDFETWLEARYPEADRPPVPREDGWPDTVEGLADLYGRLRADGGKDAARLADKVASALDEAGWRLEPAAGDAAQVEAPRGTVPPPIPAKGMAYAVFEADQLRPLVGTKVELANPKRSDVFTVELTQKGGFRLVGVDDPGLVLEIHNGSGTGAGILGIYRGDRAIKPPVEGTSIRPLEPVAGSRGIPEGVDPDAAQEGIRAFVRGEGISWVRGAWHGADTGPAGKAAADLVRDAVENGDELPFALYRGLNEGGGDAAARLAGVAEGPNLHTVEVGEVVDLPPASFTSSPESPTVRDWFDNPATVVEVRGARGVSVSETVPGISNQDEFVTAGPMRVVEVVEGDGPRRVVLEPVARETSAPPTWVAVREQADQQAGLSRVFSEGRTSRLDLDGEGTVAPPTVDDVVLDDDAARALRNEARADVRSRYDDASRRALEEGRMLPDDVEQSLNRNVVRQVEAAARRRGRQAGRLAARERRAALRTRGTANRQADRAARAADDLETQLVTLNRNIDQVATDRDALLKLSRTILKSTPDVDQQQAAIDVLMEGLLDFHDRMARTHESVLRAARDADERRLAKARRTYTRRLAAQADREAGEAVRSQPVIDLGGQLMSDAGLQQVGQQKPLSGAPVTEGLAALPPELDVTWAPEQTRLAVERFYQARIGDADVRRWVDAVYRPWFALFKAWATVGRGPGYHVRNLTGAHFNNWIGGVTAADHALSHTLVQARRQATKEVEQEAAETLAARLGIDVEEARGRVTPEVFEAEIDAKLSERLSGVEVVDGVSLYDVHRMSVATGVGDANRVLEGLSGALGEQSARDFVSGRTRANLFPQPRAELNAVQRGVNATVDNRWIRTSSGWGQLSEEYVRNAAFIQGLRRYGAFDGGRSAKMLSDGLHFDYQALTREERFLRSTLVPFYVWIRRNTPLQFRNLFLTPGKYRAVIAANEGARYAFEDDEQDVVPEWMRETLGWGSTITYGGNPIAVGVESPAIDLNRLLKVPDSLAPSDVAEAAGAVGKELLGAVSPAVKAPIEQSLGVDSFTGAPFNPNGVPAPWWYRALPDVVAPTRRDEQGQVRGSDARISALQDALPFLGLSDRAVPLTPQQRERAATNWLSLLAPVVRASTLNPRQVAGELRSRTERIDEAIKWGPGADGELLAQVADLLEQGWTADQIRQAIADGRL